MLIGQRRDLGRRDVAEMLAQGTSNLQPENDYKYLTIDLTTARTDAVFEISGSSLTVKDLGGADWSIKFIDTNHDAIPSTDLVKGDMFMLEFNRFYITNAAAPAGTAPVKLYIGRRV